MTATRDRPIRFSPSVSFAVHVDGGLVERGLYTDENDPTDRLVRDIVDRDVDPEKGAVYTDAEQAIHLAMLLKRANDELLVTVVLWT